VPNAKFQADFSSFLQAINQADVKLADFGKGANKVESSLNKMVDSFSGRKLIQEASLMTIAVEKAGGTAALTARELEQLGTRINEAADKMKRLGYEVPAGMQKLADETKNATGAGNTFGAMLTSVNGLLGAFGIGLSVTAVLGFARAILNSADSLEKLHDKTGISITGLQRFQVAGDDAGNTLDEITTAIVRMEDRLVGGDKAALGALSRLGIQFSDIKNLSPEAQFIAISDAIRKIQDPAQQVNIAIDLFGRSGAEVLPVLKRGFDDLRGSAVGMSNETVKALDDAGDATGRFWRAAKANLGEALADILTLSLSATRRLRSEWEGMIATATAAAPKMAAVLPPGLPKDLDELDKKWAEDKVAIHDTAEAHKRAGEEAKRHQAELAKLATTVSGLSFKTYIADTSRLNAIIPDMSGHVAEMADRFADARAHADDLAASSLELARVETATGAIIGGTVVPMFDKLATGSVPQATAAIKAAGNQTTVSFGQQAYRALNDVDTILTAIPGKVAEIGAVASRTGRAIMDNLASGNIWGAIVSGATGVVTVLSKLFGNNAEKQINPLRQQFVDAAGGLAQLNARAREAGVTLNALLNARTPEAYKKAIDDLNAAFKFSDDAMATLDETAQRYGFTLEELGPAMQRQNLDKQAAGLLKDWTVLNAAGIDTVAITGRMADGVNDYVKQAVRLGVEVPTAMKPMLQAMVDQGKLTDAAGNQITDLNDAGITWSQTMTEGFKSVVEEVRHLADAISGRLGVALSNIPKSISTSVDVDINGHWNIPAAPREAEFVSRGGLVTANGIQYLGAGGRVLRFTPRGSDTVPAMLSPGERVLSVQQNRAYEAGAAGGGASAVEARLASIERLLERQVREIKDGIVRANVYSVQKASRR
jgi:hypothetical protein